LVLINEADMDFRLVSVVHFSQNKTHLSVEWQQAIKTVIETAAAGLALQ